MDWKRVLRIVVCLVLVCALTVGLFPMEAKAIDPATMTAFSFAARSVVASILVSLGFEFVKGGMDDGINLVYDVFDYLAYDVIDTPYFNSSKDEILLLRDENGLVFVPDVVIDDVRSYIFAESILDDFGNVKEYWSMYGDYLLPTFDTFEDYPYSFLLFYKQTYYMFNTNLPVYYDFTNGDYRCVSRFSRYVDSVTQSAVDGWNIASSIYHVSALTEYDSVAGFTVNSYVKGEILWSNFDILSYQDGHTVWFSGSDPVTSGDIYTSLQIPLGHVAPETDTVAVGYPDWSDGAVLVPSSVSGLSQDSLYYPVSLGQTLEETMSYTQLQSWNGLGYDGDLDQETDQDQVVVSGYLSNILQTLRQLPANILSGFSELLLELFVPSSGFMDQLLDDLLSDYVFAASIAATGKDLKSFLMNLGSTPPVIRINLGAATGKYNYGGDMVLIDFSFYEPYKPQMDAILSAFLWLWFCWRIVLTLPGIISGASALVGSFTPSSAGSRGYVDTSTFSIGSSFEKDPPFSYRARPGTTAHYEQWSSAQDVTSVVERARADAHYKRKSGEIVDRF